MGNITGGMCMPCQFVFRVYAMSVAQCFQVSGQGITSTSGRFRHQHACSAVLAPWGCACLAVLFRAWITFREFVIKDIKLLDVEITRWMV